MLATLLAVSFFRVQFSAPDWANLRRPYNYSRLQVRQVHQISARWTASAVSAHAIQFTFPSQSGDTVHGILVEPIHYTHAPCVILLHGLMNSKQEISRAYGPLLLSRGIAYAAIDAPGHGERLTPADKKVREEMGTALLYAVDRGDLIKAIVKGGSKNPMFRYLTRAVISGVLDERRLLDYLATRPEIDQHHIGLWGLSMGAIMASILCPVDGRPFCALLMVGGDPVAPLLASFSPESRHLAIATCCSFYAPRFGARKVLMLNGTHDAVMPYAATARLYHALPVGTRSISWYNSDHFLPAKAGEDAAAWLAKQLAR